MTTTDFQTWLKAAAENKITTKNTWKANIIDYFSNIEEFKETHGINFQKASFTLDGCVKVYSTRVDDVSEDTNKLLEKLNDEDVTQKKKISKKRGINTLEKDLSNINIKESEEKVFYCSGLKRILNSKETQKLLLNFLHVSNDGTLKVMKNEKEFEINLKNYEYQNNFSIEGKEICPTLNEVNPNLSLINIQNNENDKDEDVCGNISLDLNNWNDVVENENLDIPAFNETPFSYVKGWAGPSYWKIESKKILGKTTKTREKYILDFTVPVNSADILIVGNTLFDNSVIEKRREEKHLLPEDFQVQVADLSKYLLRDGSFVESHTYQNIREPINEISIDLSGPPASEDNRNIDALNDEIITDLGNVKKTGLAKNILSRYTKVAKKVDIKKLNDTLFTTVEKKKETNLKSIYDEIPNAYTEKESKDISIQYCIISLLHLANEKNIELKNLGNDVIISLKKQ